MVVENPGYRASAAQILVEVCGGKGLTSKTIPALKRPPPMDDRPRPRCGNRPCPTPREYDRLEPHRGDEVAAPAKIKAAGRMPLLDRPPRDQKTIPPKASVTNLRRH
ncbi:hypothetical protein MRB53_038484 [Persea americana]|nr:hypothetical protein MRB53_038484 [Persea americana]